MRRLSPYSFRLPPKLPHRSSLDRNRTRQIKLAEANDHVGPEGGAILQRPGWFNPVGGANFSVHGFLLFETGVAPRTEPHKIAHKSLDLSHYLRPIISDGFTKNTTSEVVIKRLIARLPLLYWIYARLRERGNK